jgi:hypothetical protein
MPDYSDLLKNYTSAARQDLPPLIGELAEALGVDEDRATVEIIGGVLARAWMAGAAAGQAEVLAQAVEKGLPVQQEMLRAPDDGQDQ